MSKLIFQKCPINHSILIFMGFFLLFKAYSLHGQNLLIPSLGESKTQLGWRHIDNKKVEVIFPKTLESKAQRIASLATYLYDSLHTLGQKKHKISIILRNQTTIPNGFVTYFPFHSEFFTSPPQFNFSGTTEWLDLLTIHEYRHVQQFNNANVGWTKFFSLFFGSSGKGVSQFIALPNWFFEGDATLQETLLTPSGRGRFPDFIKDYRALSLTRKKGIYSYEQAGAVFSYKNYIPNHYHIGYYMTAFIRKKYGKNIWEKVIRDANTYRGLFYAFSYSLKKHTGFKAPELYRQTFEDLKKYWSAHADTLKLTFSKSINQKTKTTFTNYNYPHYIDKDTWLVQKSSLDEISSFYLIKRSGEEKRLFYAGTNVSHNRTVSYRDGWVIWAETRFHPRWQGTDYSIIRMKNIKNGAYRKITSKSRYFSPSLSKGKDKIIAVKVDENGNSQLHIVDLNGVVIQILKNSENVFYAFPIWDSTDKSIVVVARKNSKNALINIDLTSGKINTLIDYTTELISRPYIHNEHIFFSATYGGINNIYAYDKKHQKIYQVTSTLLGGYQPSISLDGKYLVFSEYTYKGYDLKEMPLKTENWQVLDSKKQIKNINQTWLEPVLKQEKPDILFQKNIFNQTPLKVKKYSPIAHFFNLHSWSAFPLSLLANNVAFGANIFINDKFNNFSSVLGYNYNLNEQSSRIGADIQFGALFPIFDLGINSNIDRSNIALYVAASDSMSIFGKSNNWNETDLSFGITLPINLGSGSSFRRLGFITRYHLLDLNYTNTTEDTIPDSVNELISSLELGFTFNNGLRTALKNLNTRFGQRLTLSYQRTLNSNQNNGSRFNATGLFSFPGFFKNHSLFFNAAYSKEFIGNNYKYLDIFFYSRGYTNLPPGVFIDPHDSKYRIGINYSFPLIYPDLALRGVFLWRRAYLNLFADYTKLKGLEQPVDRIPSVLALNFTGNFRNTVDQNLRSVGAELFFDIRIFRLLDLGLGVRYTIPFDLNATPYPEFIFRTLSF